jgi:hypothetical protein
MRSSHSIDLRIVFFLASALVACACGGATTYSGFALGDDGSGDGGGLSEASRGGSSGSSSSGGSSSGVINPGNSGMFGSSTGGGSSGGPVVCNPSPENYDFPGDGCDNNGNGLVDEPVVCDRSLPQAGTAVQFANAMGICQMSSSTQWGLVSATFTQGYDTTQAPATGQWALLPQFGSVIKPLEGGSLGVLSSGFALECDDSSSSTSCSASGTGDPYFKGYQMPMWPSEQGFGPFVGPGVGVAPPGYPKAAGSCPQATEIYDAIGLTLEIKVPANAQGFTFDFDFYSGEWPEYVCTAFNDSFVAWLNSAAFSGTTSGDLNVSFDSKGNPVSVNNGFFDRCTPNTITGCLGDSPDTTAVTATAACPGGDSELQGTGFYNLGNYQSAPGLDTALMVNPFYGGGLEVPSACNSGAMSTGGGATGWLTSSAPVKPGETITIQFILWDTGDYNWDSSVLLDNFKWLPGPTTTVTQRPSPQ